MDLDQAFKQYDDEEIMNSAAIEVDGEEYKQLAKKFKGRGEVKGYIFTQVLASEKAFLYKVVNNDTGTLYFEVFEYRTNNYFKNVSYPQSKSFGDWAWTTDTIEKAKKRYDDINK